jgi:DNA-binding transcriptional regulator of glucitol operon
MPDTEKPHSRMRRRGFRGLGQVIGWGVSAAFAVGVLVIVSEQETHVSLKLPFVKATSVHAQAKAQMPARPAINRRRAKPRPMLKSSNSLPRYVS